MNRIHSMKKYATSVALAVVMSGLVAANAGAQARGASEGIYVHGYWTIAVRNGDGSNVLASVSGATSRTQSGRRAGSISDIM